MPTTRRLLALPEVRPPGLRSTAHFLDRDDPADDPWDDDFDATDHDLLSLPEDEEEPEDDQAWWDDLWSDDEESFDPDDDYDEE